MYKIAYLWAIIDFFRVSLSTAYLALSRFMEMRMWDKVGSNINYKMSGNNNILKQFDEAQKKLDIETQKSLDHIENMTGQFENVQKKFEEEQDKLENVPQITEKEKVKEQMR